MNEPNPKYISPSFLHSSGDDKVILRRSANIPQNNEKSPSADNKNIIAYIHIQ
jgi:hypothetical protein